MFGIYQERGAAVVVDMKTKNDNGNATVIMLIILLLPAVIFWVVFFGAPLYPEDKTIIVDDVRYHSRVTSTAWNDPNYVTSTYTEIRILDIDGKQYEYSMNKHMFDNPMYAQINNGWNFSHEQTIENGDKYKITLWHSIFMGNYVADGFSNWNPNPEISKIVRLD